MIRKCFLFSTFYIPGAYLSYDRGRIMKNAKNFSKSA